MTKKESKEKRINDITDAAMEIFLKKGYESTTMESIAKKAGISKGGLYHYFKSKDMILMFVNQKISEEIEKIVYASMGMPSVKEALMFYIENYIRYWIEHPVETTFLFLSITKILDNSELLKYYQQFTGDYMKNLGDGFKKGVELGEFIPHDTQTSAVTLAAALDGIICYMIIDERLNLEEIVKRFEEKFIKPIES